MIRGLLDPPLTKSIRVISYYFTILFNWKNIESFYTIGMYLIISNHIYGVHIYIYIFLEMPTEREVKGVIMNHEERRKKRGNYFIKE